MKNHKPKFMLVTLSGLTLGQRVPGAKKLRINLMAKTRRAADDFVAKYPQVSILKKVARLGWVVVSASLVGAGSSGKSSDGAPMPPMDEKELPVPTGEKAKTEKAKTEKAAAIVTAFEVRTAAGRLVGKFTDYNEAVTVKNAGKTRTLIKLV